MQNFVCDQYYGWKENIRCKPYTPLIACFLINDYLLFSDHMSLGHMSLVSLLPDYRIWKISFFLISQSYSVTEKSETLQYMFFFPFCPDLLFFLWIWLEKLPKLRTAEEGPIVVPARLPRAAFGILLIIRDWSCDYFRVIVYFTYSFNRAQ